MKEYHDKQRDKLIEFQKIKAVKEREKFDKIKQDSQREEKVFQDRVNRNEELVSITHHPIPDDVFVFNFCICIL